ncbi:MAG: GTPase ObgE, partial [Nitrospirota bacterium]
LHKYNPELMERFMVAVATKLDALEDEGRVDRLRDYCKENGYPFFAISSATHEGVDKLVDFVAGKLEELKAEERDSGQSLE